MLIMPSSSIPSSAPKAGYRVTHVSKKHGRASASTDSGQMAAVMSSLEVQYLSAW